MDSKDRIAIVSRGPSGRARTRDFEDALASALRDRGYRVLIVPHIYWMRRGDAAAEILSAINGRCAMASWLYPRAAEWTLRFLVGHPYPAGAGDWIFFNLSDFCSAEECVAVMSASLGDPTSGAAAGIEEIGGHPRERWYPVIDGSRCASCGKCMEFCLFEVYGREGGVVRVERPDSCKPGCPACARVCPEKAIMFPESPDAAIAGADAFGAGPGAVASPGPRRPVKAGGDPGREPPVVTDAETGRRRRGGSVKTDKKPRGKAGPASDGRRGDLDDLIKALDELDV